MLRPAHLADDLVTFDEFCRLVKDGQKADLIDGVIYMASPDSRTANRLNSFLCVLLEGFVAAKQLGGEVFVNRYAFQITDVRAPEPDLAYVSADRLHLVDERSMHGAPDVAVEIVARESRHRDYGEKRELYEQAGVQEYWIVDPIQQRVEFLRLTDGQFALVPLEHNKIFRSQTVPGFWIDIDWLLSKPLPNAFACLQSIIQSTGN